MKPQILRDLRFLFSLVVACGPAGVPGAVGRGCGAGLRRGRWPASLMVLLVAPRVFRALEGPAAREARASLRSAPRLEARPCPPVPPAPSTPVGPGRGRVPQLCASKPGQAPPPPINFARNSPAAFSSIEFASLELQRFGVSRKMTTINYVRNLGGGGVVAARGYRSLASLLPVGIMGVSRVEFLGWSGACCYKCRQSKVFFVWISDPLLRTSSI